MEKTVVKKENLEVVVSVKVSGDEWGKQVKKEFNKKAAKVTIKGFRPGKAPVDMVKRAVNQYEVYNDAMLFFANEAYRAAITEGKFYVYTEPKINVTKIDADVAKFEVVFGLPPVVELGQYKNLGVEEAKVKVSAADVKAYIDDLVKSHAVMQVKEGAAKLGDSVIIDFVGYVDGVPFDGGDAKGYELALGSGSFIPGFEDQLVGIKAGEEKEITVKFPENYVESLKGKEATFSVKCSDVKEKVMPAMDEDFFAELSINDVKDEASLKEYAKNQVTARKINESKQETLNVVVNKAVDNAKVIIPPAMIEEEANAMLTNIKKQVEQAGLTYADYVAINGLKEEELEAQRKAEAERNLKSMLVIEKIIVDEKLEVTDADIANEYQRIADMYKMDVKSVENALAANKDQLVNQLRNSKFTTFMATNNIILAADKKAAAKEEVAEEAKPAAKKTTTKKAAAPKAEGEAKPAAKKTTTAKKATGTTTAKKTTTKKAAPKAE